MTIRKGFAALILLGLGLYGGWATRSHMQAQRAAAVESTVKKQRLNELICKLEAKAWDREERQKALKALTAGVAFSPVKGRKVEPMRGDDINAAMCGLEHLRAHVLLFREQHQALPTSLQQLSQVDYKPLKGLDLTTVRFEASPESLKVSCAGDFKFRIEESTALDAPDDFAVTDTNAAFTVSMSTIVAETGHRLILRPRRV